MSRARRSGFVRACAVMGAVITLCVPSVSWAILESCTVSATSLPFGSYNPANGVALDGTGTVDVTCSVTLVGLGASWTIQLSSGGALSYTPRQMANGAARMNYNIFTTARRTTVWGDGSGATAVVADNQTLINGTSVNHYTMYGRIPALQDVRAGAYTDSIVVTLLY